MKTKNVFLNDKKHVSFLKKLAQLALFLSGLVALPSCAGSEYKTWQEEVKLNDGRVIVVTQKRHCSAAYTGGNYATCIERESWLTIKLPEFGNQEIVWHENLKPRILNAHNGQWYVVGTPATGREFDLYNKPRPPYVGFLWKDGQWKRIPFGEIPVAIYDTNLVIDGSLVNVNLLTISGKNSPELNGSYAYRPHVMRIDPNHKSNF